MWSTFCPFSLKFGTHVIHTYTIIFRKLKQQYTHVAKRKWVDGKLCDMGHDCLRHSSSIINNYHAAHPCSRVTDNRPWKRAWTHALHCVDHDVDLIAHRQMPVLPGKDWLVHWDSVHSLSSIVIILRFLHRARKHQVNWIRCQFWVSKLDHGVSNTTTGRSIHAAAHSQE